MVTRQWKDSADTMPWVVIDVRLNNLFGCFPISTKDYTPPFFTVRDDHPDFVHTGLTSTSHIYDESIFELEEGELVKLKGELVGDLLREFREYAGV